MSSFTELASVEVKTRKESLVVGGNVQNEFFGGVKISTQQQHLLFQPNDDISCFGRQQHLPGLFEFT